MLMSLAWPNLSWIYSIIQIKCLIFQCSHSRMWTRCGLKQTVLTKLRGSGQQSNEIELIPKALVSDCLFHLLHATAETNHVTDPCVCQSNEHIFWDWLWDYYNFFPLFFSWKKRYISVALTSDFLIFCITDGVTSSMCACLRLLPLRLLRLLNESWLNRQSQIQWAVCSINLPLITSSKVERL